MLPIVGGIVLIVAVITLYFFDKTGKTLPATVLVEWLVVVIAAGTTVFALLTWLVFLSINSAIKQDVEDSSSSASFEVSNLLSHGFSLFFNFFKVRSRLLQKVCWF